MKYPVKNVFIVGGTGFLGYYTSLEFLKKGIAVSSASIPDVKLGDWFPKQVNIVSDNLDIFKATEEELVEAFKGHDAMVYGVGPDDRFAPPAPAYDFFYEKLVVQCSKVVRAARKAGVKRVAIMNSYFAYFDEIFNGKLANNHPYIRARVEQAAACINEGEKGVMDVMILQLPYIFGSMPGRLPLWKEVFLDRFEKMPAVFFPKGGTVMLHVRGVAESMVAAIVNGEHGGKYPVGLSNMKYKRMIKIMYDAIGNKKKIYNVPTWMAYLGGMMVNRAEKKHGKEGGLNYAKLMTDIQSKDLFYSDEVINKMQSDLGYKELGFDKSLSVESGIETTMQACYPEKFPNSDPANQVKEDLAIINKVWAEIDAEVAKAKVKDEPKKATKEEIVTEEKVEAEEPKKITEDQKVKVKEEKAEKQPKETKDKK